jgi:predicted ATPase
MSKNNDMNKNNDMDKNQLFKNGSTWLRADFHLHTEAGGEFGRTDGSFAGDCADWLVEQNIRAGVIANRNRFDRGEFVALRTKASEKGTGLFPGVEFSLREGARVLIVFDEAWYGEETDFINQFLDAAFCGTRANPAIPPYPDSPFDLQTAAAKLDEIGLKTGHKTGRGYFVVREGLNGIEKGRATYLKIGDFNFEALQYALTVRPDRLRLQDAPEIHNSHIRSISFQGGLMDGKQISFSPELNSLIGIRGSGKSSLLEVLRYALNISFGSQAVDREYKNDLIKHVLKSGGKITVEIANRQGATYRVEKIYGQNADIYKDNVLQRGITLDAILRQPVYFGQKDLSNKNVDFESDLVNKLVGGKLNDIQLKIDGKKREVHRIVGEWNGLGNLSQLKKEAEAEKANSEHKLNVFKEKGIAERLKLQTSFELDVSRLKERHSGIESYLDDLHSVILNHDYWPNHPVSSDANKELFAEVNLALERLKSEFVRLNGVWTESKKISAEFKDLTDKLAARKEEMKEEFARIKREINIPEANPDDYIKINREFEISKLKLNDINKSENKRKEVWGQLTEATAQLDDLWREQFLLLKREVDRINTPDGKLSIEIDYKGRKDKFRAKLQEAFKGSRITEQTYSAIADEHADFADILKDNFRRLADRLTELQLAEVKKRFQENLFDLLTYKVENRITVNYEGKQLKEHSLGQRASALILFLLSQKENDILIIDQPEDDLDNQTVYNDVIREIKRLKGEMQFIFATHNANIPVLGDSEMIIACSYIPDSEIRVETGSIDCRNIQEKIIRIMEGGKDAFETRKNIYKIWERGKV